MYMQSYGEKDEVLPEFQAINLKFSMYGRAKKSTANAIRIRSILDRYMYSGTSNGHVKLWTDRGAFARVVGDLQYGFSSLFCTCLFWGVNPISRLIALLRSQ